MLDFSAAVSCTDGRLIGMAQARTSLASLMVILVILMYLFLNSSYFTASELKWTGLVLLSAEQLDEYVNFQPANVLRLDKWAARGEHPWVERHSPLELANNMEVMVSEHASLDCAASCSGQDRRTVRTAAIIGTRRCRSILYGQLAAAECS